METHPALCARCVAVTSCLGKMGDEEGSGGEDGKRWGRWVMRKDQEERMERDGEDG